MFLVENPSLLSQRMSIVARMVMFAYRMASAISRTCRLKDISADITWLAARMRDSKIPRVLYSAVLFAVQHSLRDTLLIETCRRPSRTGYYLQCDNWPLELLWDPRWTSILRQTL